MPETPHHTGTLTCRNGDHCREYDRTTKTTGTADRSPLCQPCLDAAERDLRALLYDWYDLEQLQLPSLAQAMTGQPNGSPTPAMPLAGAPEALQAEIAHVVTTWAEIIRDRHRLTQPGGRMRPGAAVQRAIGALAPRVLEVARLDATTVYPTGCEDDPADLDGVDALNHFTRLHQRARSMLGRTRRTFWVPGDCGLCGAGQTLGVDGPLYRSEPRDAGDETQVWCDACQGWRSESEYQVFLQTLVWPDVHGDDQAEVAA